MFPLQFHYAAAPTLPLLLPLLGQRCSIRCQRKYFNFHFYLFMRLPLLGCRLFIRTCFVHFFHCFSFTLYLSLSLSDFTLLPFEGFCLCSVNCLFCVLNSLWRMQRSHWRCLLADFHFQLRLLNIYAQQFAQPLAEWRNKFSIA